MKLLLLKTDSKKTSFPLCVAKSLLGAWNGKEVFEAHTWDHLSHLLKPCFTLSSHTFEKKDLVLSDLICYTCYVCCLSKNQKKTEENKKDRKTGEMIFSKKNNKYSTSSHLRQGLCTFFWSLWFKIMLHKEIYSVWQIITFFSSKITVSFQIHQKFKFLTPKKRAETLS